MLHFVWSLFIANANTITAAAASLAALANVAYLGFTIGIFIQSRRSADAAKESADAAKKSADLVSELNRPYMAFQSQTF